MIVDRRRHVRRADRRDYHWMNPHKVPRLCRAGVDRTVLGPRLDASATAKVFGENAVRFRALERSA